MCGICGFVDYSSEGDVGVLCRMRDRLYERGPDQCGEYFEAFDDYSLGFGHRRLSVIDLSENGRQPMYSASGRFLAIYNGEIYNHMELKDRLVKEHGMPFRGTSDTEVLVNAFEAWGVPETLKKIVGMFAFGAWDCRERCLYLARDRMGEKPLYFGWQEKTFLFGSDLKALYEHPSMKKELDREALSAFIQYGYIPGSLSIYDGIHKLRPGRYAKFSPGDCLAGDSPEIATYWELNDLLLNGMSYPLDVEMDEAMDRIDFLLRQSLRGQRISDVPLGVFLSGGIDSSLIAAMTRQISSTTVRTFTIGFEEKEYNEAGFARAVAEHIGSDHTEITVSEKDALEMVQQIPAAYSEPFADSSQIPTCLVSRLTRQHVTVSLSGDGGDELFLGYRHYMRTKKRWERFLKIPFKTFIAIITRNRGVNALARFAERGSRGFGALARYLPRFAPLAECDNVEDFYRCSVSAVMPPCRVLEGDRYTGFDFHFRPAGENDIVPCIAAIDLKMFLPDDILVKVDRAAMHYSLETRTPFLDHRLVEYAALLPPDVKRAGGKPKGLLRELLARYVPRELTERPKQGFGVPLGKWLRTDLREWAGDLLSAEALSSSGAGFKVGEIRDLHRRHDRKYNDFSCILWNILMFQAWYGSVK